MFVSAIIIFVFISISAVQIYELSYIHLYASPSTDIVRTNNVTRWLGSSVGRALLRKDYEFESRSDLNFFQAFIWVKFLRMKQHTALETSTSSVSSNISPSKWISSCFSKARNNDPKSAILNLGGKCTRVGMERDTTSEHFGYPNRRFWWNGTCLVLQCIFQ